LVLINSGLRADNIFAYKLISRPELRSLKQKDSRFEVSLGYIARAYLRKQITNG
jgi:hypothetical protein